jgi:hypothetical protein
MIIAVWFGADDHKSLKKVDYVFEELRKIGADIFVGGNLSFMTSIYGLSNASNFRPN